MLRLGVGRAAVFAEPAVTEVEEMVRLIHGRMEVGERRSEVR